MRTKGENKSKCVLLLIRGGDGRGRTDGCIMLQKRSAAKPAASLQEPFTSVSAQQLPSSMLPQIHCHCSSFRKSPSSCGCFSRHCHRSLHAIALSSASMHRLPVLKSAFYIDLAFRVVFMPQVRLSPKQFL